MILVLIGPMGCGKTTIGRLLAAKLGWEFDDADDFHPPANIAKMQSGTPLGDQDRFGWLNILHQRITARLKAGENLVMACSALKDRYREILGVDQRQVLSVYLKGAPELLQQRIASRSGHFMPSQLLASQLATMEEPTGGMIVAIDQDPESVADEIIAGLSHFEGNTIMNTTADIGLIGLAVMGENLVLNMASRNIRVAVYNRTTTKVDSFLAGRAKGESIIGFHTVAELVASLARPRKVMMMLKAGEPVDQCIEQLLPLLESGDIIIDGGNSHYQDTIRRTALVEAKGMLFIGTGVSGGEEGALKGPSIMPGGSQAAWSALEPIFTAIAAKAGNDEPCCAWMGGGGAGHFVKMVHNGIEYGDMQLICESYQLMGQLLGLDAHAMHEVFARWNQGDLSSYLIEITADILAYLDDDGSPMIEKILDTAGQKGTGKWTVSAALDHGTPLSLISESVFARCISAQKELRVRAADILAGPKVQAAGDKENIVASLERALYCAKIISYAQGFELMRTLSAAHDWQLDYAAIARIWRGGCIIRSVFLDHIAEAWQQNPGLSHLLFAPYFTAQVNSAQQDLRTIVSLAAAQGIAIPCFSAALAYFDGLRTARLPANLLQAQRDYFDAHTYERIDRPRGEFFHTDWTGEGGATTSTAYSK